MRFKEFEPLQAAAAFGLALGVALSLPVGVTIVLATALAYASGFGLTMWPFLRSGAGFWPTLSPVFMVEAVSIGVVGGVMTAVDHITGGWGSVGKWVGLRWLMRFS